MANVAFLGLGVMGYPMAGHLARAGHEVCVWNRSPEKAVRWATDQQGRVGTSIADAVAGAACVLVCVGADADVDAVCAAAFPAMDRAAVLVDHSTISAATSRKLADQAQAMGLGFVDAPVSGGQAGAQNGQLTIMAGGSARDVAAAEPVMAAYAKRIGHMGPTGAGQLAKMVNQICIAGVLQGLSEAVHFSQAAGLPADLLFDVLGKGAAQSWQMDNRARTMAEGAFDFGFAVDWMRKDLGIVLSEAAAMGLDLPLTRLVDSYYAEVQAMGGARQDTSSLIRRLRNKP
jgi:3-hydroxyisobutyrate dehydrogenase-like beta-hydroxyacid dehydrogenase